LDWLAFSIGSSMDGVLTTNDLPCRMEALLQPNYG
jgi:hypothetical protein